MMLARLFETRAVRDPGWVAWGRGDNVSAATNSAAGMQVNEQSALQLLTVYGCVAFIADAISLLPVCVYRQTGEQRTEITPPTWLNEAHPDLPGPDMVNQIVASLLLAGNAYLIPVRNSTGQVLEVWPLHPSDVQVTRAQGQARATYFAYGQQLPQNSLVHIRALTLPGQVVGLNPVAYARQTIGAGLAMEEFGGRWFGEGSSPSGIVETPTQLTQEQTGMLRENFEQFHRGVKKSHGVAVLSGGATYRPITIAPEDAQFLETRNMTAAQIAAAMFRLPPDFVGATLPGGSSLTYQNITDRWTEVSRRALLPWISRIEWAFSYRMLPRPQVAKFDMDEYTRPDLTARYGAYAVGKNAGFLTNEDIRSWEDLPPITEPSAPVVSAADPAPPEGL